MNTQQQQQLAHEIAKLHELIREAMRAADSYTTDDIGPVLRKALRQVIRVRRMCQ